MARLNDPDIFLKRARECEALAATTAESRARDILLQMAEGYWILLSVTNGNDEQHLSQRRISDT